MGALGCFGGFGVGGMSRIGCGAVEISKRVWRWVAPQHKDPVTAFLEFDVLPHIEEMLASHFGSGAGWAHLAAWTDHKMTARVALIISCHTDVYPTRSRK